MSTSTSHLAFQDCYDAMDKALEDAKGIRVPLRLHGDAMHFRVRMNAARRIDRERNAHIYDEGEPLHGVSIYDKLTFKIKQADGRVWLYIEQFGDLGAFESLSDVADEEELAAAAPEDVETVQENQLADALNNANIRRRI